MIWAVDVEVRQKSAPVDEWCRTLYTCTGSTTLCNPNQTDTSHVLSEVLTWVRAHARVSYSKSDSDECRRARVDVETLGKRL